MDFLETFATETWIVVSVLLVILEVFTAGFGAACFAIGGGLAAIVAACGLGWTWQLLAFGVGSVLAMLGVRPLMLKVLNRKGGDMASNADALVGRAVRVTERIDAAAGTGRVSVDGSSWRAECGEVVEAGEMVHIMSVNSTKLLVSK